MPVHSKKVTFQGAHETSLDARLDMPDGEPEACALFAHCFTCSKDLFIVSQISRHLADKGIAVLRFDFTGLGHSEGEFENTNFSSNVADLVAAAEFMEAEYEAPSILIGHSFGGTAVLKAAADIPQAKAVCTIGSPFDPAHVEQVFKDKLSEIEEEGSADVEIAGRTFSVEKHFLDDIRSTEMEGAIGELKRPLLIFHSPQDKVVGVDNARLIFQAAKHPKSFISLDGADHLLSNKRDAQYVAETLAAWSTRYVQYRRELTDEEREALGEPRPDEALVAETGEGKFMNHVIVGRHHFFADEPASVGGNDAGPDPYDLVAAALGACTSMTLRMYAERKGWPLERVQVRVNHDKIHAGDCAHCEKEKGKIDKLTRAIRVEGDLDDAQRKRLLEIADRCPVHQTLRRENVIESSLESDLE
ncbi:OsmC family protein [Persicimonas caeni]|uniref:OsmC family protein n=1 Tax=Persicimonas caeni TaxID=2292766 RepID=A0A4Y6PXF1_PERCE|nr:bifunctional alpha/beta hydrolase/OsmC family protein [Persicimonas caeni]QDG52809.1 OsmC family protein [Persicimonas caeni]QED34031.1 OsmC family protein [Persicimonas caeni]